MLYSCSSDKQWLLQRWTITVTVFVAPSFTFTHFTMIVLSDILHKCPKNVHRTLYHNVQMAKLHIVNNNLIYKLYFCIFRPACLFWDFTIVRFLLNTIFYNCTLHFNVSVICIVLCFTIHTLLYFFKCSCMLYLTQNFIISPFLISTS